MQGVNSYSVELAGLVPIMFDRYPGDNETTLPPERKMYFAKDKKTLIFPQANLVSFLTATKTTSAPKVIYDTREYKKICNALASFVAIEPFEIPFTSDGEPVVFAGWNEQILLDERVARLDKGIPNPKKRPVLQTPWELSFVLHHVPDQDVLPIRMVQDIFVMGGIRVGLGTFRPIFGKFRVVSWEKFD